MYRYTFLVLLFLVTTHVAASAESVTTPEKIIIAHRGACGYLPEHSLPAKAMAYAMNPHYIEQDTVLTRDGHVVILHDHYLDRVTNVADLFPTRKREDGRWYAIDFTLEEIRTLAMTEGFSMVDGAPKSNYQNRFPLFKSRFHVSTLEEELELIQGLNHSTGKNIGVYVEVKSPWFHRREGQDISQKVLTILKKYGYDSKDDNIFLQCFDPGELQRIKKELLPTLGIDLKLVQLMSMTSWGETEVEIEGKWSNLDVDWMHQDLEAMKKIATWADGIGPWYPMIISEDSTKENLKITHLVAKAHEAGLVVHPYTFRLDPGKIPAYAKTFKEFVQIFLYQADVDGIFTDFPDQGILSLKK